MKKLKKLLKKEFELESNCNETYVLKGREPNVKSVSISLHYNFTGLKLISLAYTTTTPFDAVKDTIYDSISPNSYDTATDLVDILVHKEHVANKHLERRISDYIASLAQFSLFNPDTQETT